MEMMRKSIGIHFVQSRETWESGSLSPEKIFKSLSVESEKTPLCLVGKSVYIYMIDLHSGVENIILPSNLCCTNLKNSKV